MAEPWKPTPKQEEFLSCADYEVLYGGAAGGGKSDALTIDALGLNHTNLITGEPLVAVEHPRYCALLLRPSITDLEAFIRRARTLYEAIVPGVEWYEGKKQFVFPSGAIIKFGYMKEASDMYRYKSEEFQYIGFEELTQFPSEDGYEYVCTRCRGVPEIPKLIRATTNPDGPGNKWVRERFRIPDDGAATRFAIQAGDEVRVRRFIPAKVSDNPHIDPTYENTLKAGKSEQTKNALLYGRWDLVDMKGAILAPQLEEAMIQGRITALPIENGLPVNCFWDLGNGDGCGVWFHQKVGFQNRFFDYYEAENKPLSHYAAVIKEKGYLVEAHYLPHDAVHKKLDAYGQKSIRDMFHDLNMSPTIIVPRVERVAVGIERMRVVMSSCWFDPKRASQGVKALSNYQFKWDDGLQRFKELPLHNWASRGADAFRQFAQGYKDVHAPNTKFEQAERERMRDAMRMRNQYFEEEFLA